MDEDGVYKQQECSPQTLFSIFNFKSDINFEEQVKLISLFENLNNENLYLLKSLLLDK